MTGTSFRYRGAQPFGDDEVSRRTFFGRDAAAHALTDQILANRLVVVYARSGVGKSSLLNAGVAQRLREADCQPLMLRVNDLRDGAAAAVRAAVAAEAQRQGVEYVPGTPTSLWEFFKTVEFWRGDTLLTPVLVLDQFEELFTLHDESVREALLGELGPLVRGVPPAEAAVPGRPGTPPALHVVLSLREEFLGMLDDAADRIPQIMDHRFRLTPLRRGDAAVAMRGPAEIEDPLLGTKPFRMAPAFVDAVLEHLGAPGEAPNGRARRPIEPFHLQLVCQRVEQIIAADPALAAPGRQFDLADFGGIPALNATLTAFYTRVVDGIPSRSQRAAARRLCEDYLISPEGRRLSLDATLTRERVGLSEAALHRLMEDRLLRSDRRSDALYVELGHDALVEPILATRRARAMVAGWAAKAAGAALGALAVFLALIGVAALVIDGGAEFSPSEGVLLAALLALFAGALTVVAAQLLQSGRRIQRRFSQRASAARGGAGASGSGASPARRHASHWLRALGVGIQGLAVVLLVWGLFYGMVAIRYGGSPPAWASWLATTATEVDQLRALVARPWIEAPWLLVPPLALWSAGGAMGRWADALAGHLTVAHVPGLVGRLLQALTGLVVVAVLALVGLGWRCYGAGQGSLPGWWPLGLTPLDVRLACSDLGPSGAGDNSIGLYNVILVMISLILAVSPGLTAWIVGHVRAHRPPRRS